MWEAAAREKAKVAAASLSAASLSAANCVCMFIANKKKAAPSSLGDAALHYVALPPAGDYFTTLRPFWMKMPFWALFTRTPLRL